MPLRLQTKDDDFEEEEEEEKGNTQHARSKCSCLGTGVWDLGRTRQLCGSWFWMCWACAHARSIPHASCKTAVFPCASPAHYQGALRHAGHCNHPPAAMPAHLLNHTKPKPRERWVILSTRISALVALYSSNSARQSGMRPLSDLLCWQGKLMHKSGGRTRGDSAQGVSQAQVCWSHAGCMCI
jgi:hypothetical protein